MDYTDKEATLKHVHFQTKMQLNMYCSETSKSNNTSEIGWKYGSKNTERNAEHSNFECLSCFVTSSKRELSKNSLSACLNNGLVTAIIKR